MKHSCDPLRAETWSETEREQAAICLFPWLCDLASEQLWTPPHLAFPLVWPRVVTHCWRISRQCFTGNFELGWNQH